MKKFILGLLAVGFVSGVSVEARAQSPFEFSYGYSLGYQNSFRNRLPAPPYFSVFPPVYYGQRYERPYGESPFASWPLLQPNESYQPVRASSRVSIPTPAPYVLDNPYVLEDASYQTKLKNKSDLKPVPASEESSVVAASDAEQPSKPVVIQPLVVHNPFVRDLVRDLYVSK